MNRDANGIGWSIWCGVTFPAKQKAPQSEIEAPPGCCWKGLLGHLWGQSPKAMNQPGDLQRVSASDSHTRLWNLGLNFGFINYLRVPFTERSFLKLLLSTSLNKCPNLFSPSFLLVPFLLSFPRWNDNRNSGRTLGKQNKWGRRSRGESNMKAAFGLKTVWTVSP